MNIFLILFTAITLASPNSINIYEKVSNHLIRWNGTNYTAKAKNTHIFVVDNFRVIYETSGKNKVNPIDRNKNKVPDYVEDVSKQIWASHHLFNRLGFHSPFKSETYGHTESVDIFIVHPSRIRNLLGLTIIMPVYAFERPKTKRAIRMYISSTLNIPQSTTPTHEYFHLIQSSMSNVRNDWYFEGLARWSEGALSPITLKMEKNWNLKKLLNSPLSLNYVLSSSYTAAKVFWLPIAVRDIKSPRMFFLDTDPLRKLTYSNGAPVLRDTYFHGTELMRIFLEQLAINEQKITRKYKVKNWLSSAAKNTRNNDYIFDALWTARKIHKKNEASHPKNLLPMIVKRLNSKVKPKKNTHANH